MKAIATTKRDAEKICLYNKYQFESKHQLLINGREKVQIIQTKYAEALIDQSLMKIWEDYNPTEKRSVNTV